MPPDALICTKFEIFWGFAPDPTGGAYSAPRPPSWVEGGRFAAGEGRGREGRGEEGRRSLLSRPTFQLVPTPLLSRSSENSILFYSKFKSISITNLKNPVR